MKNKEIKVGEALKIFLEEHPEYYLIAPSSIKIKISPEEIKQIKILRKRGMSLRELGQAFSKSHETIRTILKK